jgi:hypothetical protein|tara:strand:+ start:19191 stop:19367 length:177 start_codon:yes stop_codon:yes gene_type:complete
MATKTKTETKTTKTKAVVSNDSSIKTRLEIVEKMLLVTRDELKEMKGIFERIKSRMGL